MTPASINTSKKATMLKENALYTVGVENRCRNTTDSFLPRKVQITVTNTRSSVSGGLNTAASGSGTGADEHQQHGKHFSKLILAGNVHRGKPRRAGIGGLEKRTVEFFQNIQTLHGIVELQHKKPRVPKRSRATVTRRQIWEWKFNRMVSFRWNRGWILHR